MSLTAMLSPMLVLAATGVMATEAHADAAADPAASPSANADGTQVLIVTGRPLADSKAASAYDSILISRETLLSSASGRIEDVLSGVAGFQQFRRSDSRSTNPSAQGVTLRALGGNAAARTLVLLDGVPMADPMFGSVALSAIAPERLANIRVTRGGGSGAFGSGAVAGTIALESAGRDTTGAFSGDVSADTRGETSLSGSVAPKLGQGFAVISGRWDRGQGFWTTPLDQRVPASAKAAYDGWSVSARGVAPVAPDIELQGRVLAFRDQRTLRFAGADSRSFGEDASIRLVARGPWQVDALAYLQDRGFSNVVISSTTFKPTLDQRSTPSTGLGGKLEVHPPVGPNHQLRLGTDWRRTSGDLSEVSYNSTTGAVSAYRWAGGTNDDKGLFLEDDWRIGILTLTGGIRGDHWSIERGYVRTAGPTGAITADNSYDPRDGWALSGRGGALLRVANGVTLRGSAYSGLRQPTINELYRTFTVFPVTTNANPLLGNERLKGVEGGVDLGPFAGVTLSATGFVNRLEHAIANVTTGVNLKQRQNVDAIRARGVEVDAKGRWGAITLDASLALTDSVVEASGAAIGLNGLRPAQTPKIATSTTLGWAPAKGWQLSATVRYVGAQFEDDANAANSVLRPATTIGLFARAPLSHGFAAIVRVENLTDVTVMTRNQAGSIDVGVPRTVWLGVHKDL
ncbi:TonB-dependent receptor [Novosphingobium sp.]|uniref:TonB-dependent receptor plug domain-containing protein n=1 Tax=Novosphingobium sp. TaxID=1874826 RepID=UPI0031D36652